MPFFSNHLLKTSQSRLHNRPENLDKNQAHDTKSETQNNRQKQSNPCV